MTTRVRAIPGSIWRYAARRAHPSAHGHDRRMLRRAMSATRASVKVSEEPSVLYRLPESLQGASSEEVQSVLRPESDESFFNSLLDVVESNWSAAAASAENTTSPLPSNEHAYDASMLEAASAAGDAALEEEDALVSPDYELPADLEQRKLVLRQIELEEAAKEDAIESFSRFATESVERRKLVLPFERLIKFWITPVATSLASKSKGTVANAKDASLAYLRMLSPETLAALAIHNVICAVINGDKPMQDVSRNTGAQIMGEISYQTLDTAVRKRRRQGASKQDVLQSSMTLLQQINSKLDEHIGPAMGERYQLHQLASTIDRGLDATPTTITRLGAHAVASVLECCRVLVNPESGQVRLVDDPNTEDAPSSIEAFQHVLQSSNHRGAHRRLGMLRLAEPLMKKLQEDVRMEALRLAPKYSPMLIKPRPWTKPKNGGYLLTPTELVRVKHYRLQQSLLWTANLKSVYDGLNALGDTPWRVNKKVLEVVETLWNSGGQQAGLVSRVDFGVKGKEKFFASSETAHMTLQQKERAYRQSVYDMVKRNAENHSIRCDTWYKINSARQLAEETALFLPYNLDFRGRAYPLSAHLQHTGNDLCRGLLTFGGKGVELGDTGLYWLKIHLANLLGGDKRSLRDRIDFADEAMTMVIKTANNPLDDDCIQWWSKQSDPFQLIACCMEVAEAVKNGERNACRFVSSLPVHMDGSCNGLQHYAALGRDAEGGAAVNLCPTERPADVYSQVLKRVVEKMQRDEKKGSALAKVILPKMSRKIVKQTVMTSVYGVTGYGAREQIIKQLEAFSDLSKMDINKGGRYVADLTLDSLGDLFRCAKGIMGWLADGAEQIARQGQPVHWITPLGLPCVQPYHKIQRLRMRTTLQAIQMRRTAKEGDEIAVLRQRSAFPPNFIHSLDSSHMLLTAKRCVSKGMNFAAVHDSFWTNAAHVGEMNSTLRETFIDLHSRSLLEELLEHFRLCYPGLELKEVPARGKLDLSHVRHAEYFFD